MYQTEIGTDLAKAKALLEQGELVVIPTETVYGLAGNALNPDAVAKIYETKNRPQFNPLILHVSGFKQMQLYAEDVPHDCLKLTESFSPGPLTFLLNKRLDVPDMVTAGSKRVAIRIPNQPLTLQLLDSLNFPLAAPSANPSGYVSPVNVEHVVQGLYGKIPYILDGGAANVGLESTIVGFEAGETVMHRLGGIALEEIEQVLGKPVKISITHDAPETPGQLKSHYATYTKFVVGDLDALKVEYAGKHFGIISFSTVHKGTFPQIVLSINGNLREAASKLFTAMREMDAQNFDLILAEWVPDVGIGKAINDRLRRAAH